MAACDNCGDPADAPTCPEHPTCTPCLAFPNTCRECRFAANEWATDTQADQDNEHAKENR